MRVIHKFIVQTGFDTQPIQIPYNHEVRHVGLDPNGIMCIWAEVNVGEPAMTHLVHVIGTGHPLPDVRALKHGFLGSVVQGPFVWHLWM